MDRIREGASGNGGAAVGAGPPVALVQRLWKQRPLRLDGPYLR